MKYFKKSLTAKRLFIGAAVTFLTFFLYKAIASKPTIRLGQSINFEAVDKQINADIENGFPGAVLFVFKDGQILKNTAYGYKRRYDEQGRMLDKPEKMTTDTLFDLASNTKMYATNFAIMHLVYQKKLDINKPIKYYLPQYIGCDKGDPPQCRDDRLVKDLLMHSAGYMPSPQFYNPESIKKYGPDLYSQDRQLTINLLLSHLPFAGPRAKPPVYSDVDFMLLGILIEKITGQRLDVYVHNAIYKPLGLENTTFKPRKRDCAATELAGNTRDGTVSFPNIRKYTLEGEVQDENSYYSMDGIAGHAGLFSNVNDLAILLQVVLNNGRNGNVILWDKEVEEAFTKPNPDDDSYALGWRRAGSKHYFPFGDYAPPDTIGHTGFTGTLTVIDKKNNLFFILLTNKVHTKFINGEFDGNNYATGHYQEISNLIYQALGLQPPIKQQNT